MEKKIKTAVVILIKNSAANTMSATIADFRRFVKKYLGTSRYLESENDGSDDPVNGIVVKGVLSKEEKKELMDYNENSLILLFLEQDENDDDVVNDNNTITSKQKNENN